MVKHSLWLHAMSALTILLIAYASTIVAYIHDSIKHVYIYWCFVDQTSKLIRLPRCSRKTMVASNRHKDLYWFRPEPYVQSQRWSSACFSLECSEVLTMGGCKNGGRGRRARSRRWAAQRKALRAQKLWRWRCWEGCLLMVINNHYKLSI